MSQSDRPTDLDLAALIASKICHDAIGPVGAIYNGLEILDEDDDPQSQAHALEIIRNVTIQASSRLQFARFAFGAAGSAGSLVDLTMAEQITRGYVGDEKHKLIWNGPAGHMGKDYVKLLLNLIASSITCLPRGGTISVSIEGDLEQPTLSITCSGTNARPPQHLPQFLSGEQTPEIDALTIQAYYTARLAELANMIVSIKGDNEIVIAAVPR